MAYKLTNKIDEYIANSIIDGNTEIIDTFLKENNYDISEIDKLSEKNYKKLSFKIKGIINAQKDDILLEKAVNLFQEAINKNIEKPISFLKSLLTNKDYAFHYRNLEKLSKNEIKEIIKEHNLLDILEKLEQDGK